MITDAILQFFATIAGAAVDALPTWTPTVDTQAIVACRAWLGSYDNILPIHELTDSVIVAACTIFSIMYGASIVVKIADLIRGAGA